MHVREKLVAYLLETYPDCLPRTRAELHGIAPGSPDGAVETMFQERKDAHEHGQPAT